MSKDITYCMKTDCEIETCIRNQKHITDDGMYSFMFLEDTEDCEKEKVRNE